VIGRFLLLSNCGHGIVTGISLFVSGFVVLVSFSEKHNLNSYEQGLILCSS